MKSLKKALEFYTETLGFELIKLQTNDAPYAYDIVNIPGLEKVELAFIKIPDGTVIELLEYVGVDTYSGAARTCDYGTGHICLSVSNLEAMYNDLLAKGIEFISEKIVEITVGKHKGQKAVYMKDPDGYVIELMGD